ncbi:hypothetical protein GOP47_0006802 [Adiantum capillus-veneris]|uniref:Uncharacterized protein n=1 Tax=Adiantum capillus-veneris TaxID=13818 RepID=A0A9D4V4B9_ADICA|nr:hypothetical protein GOP47_0006802 [Adiantum capillus-veneris]
MTTNMSSQLALGSSAAMNPATSSRYGKKPHAHEDYSQALEQLLTGPKLMAAPLQHLALPHEEALTDLHEPRQYAEAKLAAAAAGRQLGSETVAKLPKVVREYPMPAARETHEMAVVGENLLVVTQQSNSTLVKVQLDPSTGRPIACVRFVVGDFWHGLHGLASSLLYPGQVWASLQFKSLLIRINPGQDLATHPSIEQVITLPPSVYGPHCVCECGTHLWTSCKDSSHVVRINHARPLEDYSVYPCSRRPIFIAMHPTSHDVYASLDVSSKIWRLQHATGATHEIDIPSSEGTIPVGLVAGPDGNVWFTLLGDASGGTGTFARIFANGHLQFFSLTTSVGAKAGLIHLAFDWEHEIDNCIGRGDSTHHLWLLSSSLIARSDGYGIDAVFGVVLDDSKLGGGRIINQHSISLPTQRCANHRILPHRTGLFVSQLSISSLAHVSGAAAFKPAEMVGEGCDMYNAFGQGQPSSHYVFAKERVSREALLINPASNTSTASIAAPAAPIAHEVLDLKRSSSSIIAGRSSHSRAKRSRLLGDDSRAEEEDAMQSQ